MKTDADAEPPRITPQIVGNAGLYYVCYRLSLRGWNAMPTSRNARGVDLICYNHDCSRMIGVQVKALSKRSPVPLGKTIDKVMGDYWVVINNLRSTPVAYVLLPEEVKALAHRGVKEDKVSCWLQPRSYEKADFREAWGRFDVKSDDVFKEVSPFFGSEASDHIQFCRCHYDVIRYYLHGLLTLRPAPRTMLQRVAADPASIRGWSQSLKENPSHVPILAEFITRLIRHHDSVLSAGRRLAGDYLPSSANELQVGPEKDSQDRR